MVKVGNREVELKFSFNSYKYMTDLDVSLFDSFDTKPFLMIQVLETLAMGAINNNPRNFFTVTEVQNFIEKEITDGNLIKLFEELMKLLEDSDFFKALQEK